MPLSNHRHRARMSLTAVLGVNMLEHRVSRECSRILSASLKVLDMLCVSTGKTDESRTITAFTDSVHDLSVHELLRYPM